MMAKCSGSIAIIEVSDGLTTFYQYAYNTSGTTAPTSGWSQSVPASAAGRFVWRREGTALSYDDVTSWGNEVCLTGATGATGATGKGISSIVEYYAVSASNSTAPSSWSTSMPTLTATNKYLWNYTRYTYTGGTYVDTTKIVIGTYGDKGDTGSTGSTGVGVSSIAEKYAASSSNSTEPTSWQDTVPTLTATNRYLWNYEIFTLTNGTTTNTKKRVIGVYGDKGATGATGATGNGISSIVNYYLASASGSGITNASSGFTSSIQTLTATLKYLWNYELITYTNGTTAKSPACVIGVYGDKGATGATGPKGDKGATGATGAAAKSVTVSCADPYWHYTGRGALTDSTQSIVLTANPVNFTPSAYQWHKDGTAISGATSATYTVPSGETGTYRVVVDSTYSASITVGSVTDGKSEGMYLGVLATAGDAASWTAAYGGYKVPSGKFSGQNLAEGDYYVYDNSGTVTNYWFNGSSWEVASGSHLSLFTNAFWDVMSLGTTQPSGSFYTLWAKYFMAMEAVIVSLGASQIHLQTLDGKSGCVYGGSYNADGTCSDTSKAGFWLGESGDFKVNNITATGILSLRDSNGNIVFENTLENAGEPIALATRENDSYKVSDLKGGYSENTYYYLGTSSVKFDGANYGSGAIFCTSPSPISLSETIKFFNDAYASYDYPIYPNFTGKLKLVIQTGQNHPVYLIYIKVNGTTVASYDASSATAYISVSSGDTVIINLVHKAGESNIANGTITRSRVISYTPGYLHAVDDNGEVVYSLGLDNIYNKGLHTLQVGANAHTSFINYIDGSSLKADIPPQLAIGNYECSSGSTLTLAGTSYTITSVTRTSNSIVFTTSEGKQKVIPLNDFFQGGFGFSFTPVGYKAGIIVRSVNAVGGGSCGTAAHPFSDGYFDNFHLNGGKGALPVGAVYVQLAGQSSPEDIFTGTWEDISSTYAGLFFRAAGGNAAEFGSTQTDAIAGTSHGLYDAINRTGWPNGSSDTGNGSTVAMQYWRGKTYTAYINNVETRPVNSTVKIWKRTA